eukprot:TRINITY_DN8133_c0_g1_i1.p1 TRINITY_DN8133_c0_g1~~TRINITY_DN8133_c0_g1_i1.p1  ORF type:complete len:295 (-),score=53.51 TRINITY_DN8133_c0_g1_i1:6-890(-)
MTQNSLYDQRSVKVEGKIEGNDVILRTLRSILSDYSAPENICNKGNEEVTRRGYLSINGNHLVNDVDDFQRQQNYQQNGPLPLLIKNEPVEHMEETKQNRKRKVEEILHQENIKMQNQNVQLNGELPNQKRPLLPGPLTSTIVFEDPSKEPKQRKLNSSLSPDSRESDENTTTTKQKRQFSIIQEKIQIVPCSDSNTNHVNDARKRRRERATSEQKTILEAAFADDQLPSKKTKERLAQKLGISVKRVQIWFQNRRAKEKQNGSGTAADHLFKDDDSDEKEQGRSPTQKEEDST